MTAANGCSQLVMHCLSLRSLRSFWSIGSVSSSNEVMLILAVIAAMIQIMGACPLASHISPSQSETGAMKLILHFERRIGRHGSNSGVAGRGAAVVAASSARLPRLTGTGSKSTPTSSSRATPKRALLLFEAGGSVDPPLQQHQFLLVLPRRPVGPLPGRLRQLRAGPGRSDGARSAPHPAGGRRTRAHPLHAGAHQCQ